MTWCGAYSDTDSKTNCAFQLRNKLDMCDEKIAIRVLLRHYWKKGRSVRAAVKEICDVEGVGAVSKSTANNWFRRFQNGDTDLEDRPRTGRPEELDDEALLEEVEEDPKASTRDLSAVLSCHYSTVDRHLRQLGFEPMRPRVVPHELTPKQAQRRIDVCKQLLEYQTSEQFLERIVTCDENVYISAIPIQEPSGHSQVNLWNQLQKGGGSNPR